MLFQERWSITCCRRTHANTQTNKHTNWGSAYKTELKTKSKRQIIPQRELHDHITEQLAINSVNSPKNAPMQPEDESDVQRSGISHWMTTQTKIRPKKTMTLPHVGHLR